MSSGILGPNGLPVNRTRAISDAHLQAILTQHEKKIGALAAQQVQLGVMVEYLTKKIVASVPEFEIDQQEFADFRIMRFDQMKKEAIESAKKQAEGRADAMAAAAEVAAEVAAEAAAEDEPRDLDDPEV